MEKLNEGFLPHVVDSQISGETLNQYLVQHCDQDTILRIKAVEKAVEVVTHNTIKQSSVKEFIETFESIYNHYTKQLKTAI